jgi:uncharacterized membrane protein
MTNKINPEFKTILFYILYFSIAFVAKIIDKGGPCAPGLGDVLILLSIPVSIIYFLILVYKNYRYENNLYLKSIYIHLVL